MLQVNAELHCHTTYSDGWGSPQACIRQARRKGLQVLAITDHNTAAGGLPFWKDPLQEGLLVIPGEEISTDRGHVLAYFVKETISPGRFEDVLGKIRKQNALAFMAHPYHIPLGNHWRKKRIYKLSQEQLFSLDGIEIENGRNRAEANHLAWGLAASEGIFGIGGSDAHLLQEIGNVSLKITLTELTHEAVKSALTLADRIQPVKRRFNAYGIYLFLGILNKVRRQKYEWKPE